MRTLSAESPGPTVPDGGTDGLDLHLYQPGRRCALGRDAEVAPVDLGLRPHPRQAAVERGGVHPENRWCDLAVEGQQAPDLPPTTGSRDLGGIELHAWIGGGVEQPGTLDVLVPLAHRGGERV